MRFFKTLPHDCSYIAGEAAETVFLDPSVEVSHELYDKLNAIGFRRSGDQFYRPDCASCQRCQPVRLRVDEFEPRRRHRRILSRNKDVSWRLLPVHYEPDYWCLYEAYINARHADGDMHPPDPDDFYRFLLQQTQYGFLMEGRIGEQLTAVAVVDRLASGFSAIYTFFDPVDDARSLGIATILQQIRLTREFGLPFLYLGYWIDSVPNMAYKSDFAPLDVYRDDQWQAL